MDDINEDFGIQAPGIRTPEQRLAAWATIGWCMNAVKIDGAHWSWDTNPRRQKNGAAIGRVYRQPRGELSRDVGAYKIGTDGRVLALPAALREVLPGGLEATAADVDEELAS